MDETEAFCQSVIRDITGQESHGERPHQAGDYSFNNIGISSFFMLLSTMKDSHREELGYYAVGGCGANIAWHTEEDLIHIADREILLKDIKIYLVSVMGVANATIAPFNFRQTLRTARRHARPYQGAVSGIYDFARAQGDRRVDATLGRCGTHACKAAAASGATRRCECSIRHPPPRPPARPEDTRAAPSSITIPPRRPRPSRPRRAPALNAPRCGVGDRLPADAPAA
jgi:hypothetical protein